MRVDAACLCLWIADLAKVSTHVLDPRHTLRCTCSRDDWRSQADCVPFSLDRATTYGRFDIARLFVRSGSRPNSQDSNGATPSHTAARNGQLGVVKLLLGCGADVYVKDNKNQIPYPLVGTTK